MVVTHQAETTVQGATFNMRGQLYRGHANTTALSSRPMVSALGSESDDPGSSPGRGKALCPWDKKKKRAPLLGLAKSIYYSEIRVSASNSSQDNLNYKSNWFNH